MNPETLGSYLRSGREEAGLTLEALALQTKISRQMLLALEEDRHDEMPAPVFVKGFVRAYCDAVGIDAARGLEMLADEHGVTTAGPVANPAPDRSGRPSIFLTAPTTPTGPRGLRISRLVLLLFAFALFVAAYVLTSNQKGEPSPSTASTGAPAVETGAPSPPPDTREGGVR